MSDDDSMEDTIDIQLRPAEAVARRCIILATILLRFSIEAESQDDRDGALFDLHTWLRDEDLWDDATESERTFLLRKPEDAEAIGDPDAALTAECLVTLGWALGLHYSHSDDRLAELPALIHQIPSPWDRTESWLIMQSLRPESDIARVREVAEIWQWRLEIEPERRAASGRERAETEDMIQTVTQDAIAAELLAPGGAGGFILNGVLVTAMPLAEIAEQQEVAQERLLALNWLCGFGDDWDNVPIDV